MKNIFSLEGKVAIITGGGQGLGKAMACGMAEFGADVVVAEISSEKTTDVIDKIKSLGRKGIFIPCDVSKLNDIDRVVKKTVSEFGHIDILVNNAFISVRELPEDVTEEHWDRVLEVDLKGVFFFCQRAGQIMIKQKKGNIINMATIAAIVGLPRGNASYTAAKGGIVSMTRMLAVEWAKHNIRVNAIAPCQFKTPSTKDLLQPDSPYRQSILNAIPLGRAGEPEEIVGPAVFLASDASSMVTGHVLMVDGGMTIY